MIHDQPTTAELDALLMAADPLPAAWAAALPVADAQAELCRALQAEPRAPRPAPAPPPARRARRRLAVRLSLAVGVLFAVSLVALSLGRSGEKGGTVWAAELVRLAEASPLVLLQAPGWHVSYADEQSAEEGEIHFSTGPAAAADDQRTDAALNWRAGSLAEWKHSRAAEASVRTTAPVLGTTAGVYQYTGGRPGHQDITSVWGYDGRVLEFRAGAADIAAFKALLAHLQRVDTDAWLSALPDSVVKSADRSSAIAGMLRGVTAPPGFDPGAIKGAALTKDRYQLGAAVSGTVACTWIKRWSDARRDGDPAGVREAIAAMATAKDWPVLKEMSKSGAYPEFLARYAAAMPSGRWYGRPLEGDADSGLGCSALGIPLG
jgi:hypothetical protein